MTLTEYNFTICFLDKANNVGRYVLCIVAYCVRLCLVVFNKIDLAYIQ